MNIEEKLSEPDPLTTAVSEFMDRILSNMGVSEQWSDYTKLFILILLVTVIVYLLQYLTRTILRFVFRKVYALSKLSFFDYTIRNKLPNYLARAVPYSFVRGAIPVVLYRFDEWIMPLIKLTDIYMVFMVIWTIMALVKSLFNVMQEKPAFHGKPIKSYVQVIYILFFLIGAVIIYTIITGNSTTTFFAAMGAASAILMLIFQDSIKGFVGSIQVSANNMVQIGDWITMNKYGADGDVEEITLTTVKIRNFDKTITTIPTYALISDSFQNWRGMNEYGGRRFKRALNIKQDSIRFLTVDELEKFKNMSGLRPYIEKKQREYADLNEKLGSEVFRVTNNDLYLQYGVHYLRQHPRINKKLTLMVRQLAPTTQGIPMELYTFTSTTIWAEYEIILSEVVNHFISITPEFGLTLYEQSSGSDVYNVNMRRLSDPDA